MSKNAIQITLLVATKNTMPFTEVFCKTAMKFLACESTKFQILFIDGDSVDGTKEYLYSIEKKFSFPSKVICRKDFNSEAQKCLDKVVADNNNMFNECVWDFSLYKKLITTPLYIGLHIDIAFKKKGLLIIL